MASHVLTASVLGLDALPVDVETDIAPGLSTFIVVGLPDTAVQEARERVKSAMKHADADFPRTRVIVNLAPADLRKSGTPFDLPMAIGILLAQGSLPDQAGKNRLFAGELGLDGSLRPIHGALSFALLAREYGVKEFILPLQNAEEASFVTEVDLLPAQSLRQVIGHLCGTMAIPVFRPPTQSRSSEIATLGPDFSCVRGQEQARRTLEIAAAGGHNLLMQGPPGSGKTLLSRAFPSILPDMTQEEALEVTRIHSIAGTLIPGTVMRERPFRTPHHSASIPSIIGGGSVPHPGEISLAHRGVLFLDEFLEFPRAVLESLRQPLEDGCVTVSRTQGILTFPARFTLIAAMNPCPCGFATDRERTCTCSPVQKERYGKRLSGPLLDRIDLFVDVPKVKPHDLVALAPAESSREIRARVQMARDRQAMRYACIKKTSNAELTSEQCGRFFHLNDQALSFVRQAAERFCLSARAYFRLLKVSQTIADLNQSKTIELCHITEAVQYRQETPGH